MIMEKINIAELLKDCPMGMELDCVMYDNLYFKCIREHPIYPIVCYTIDSKGEKNEISFNWYGKHTPIDTAKCVIFPKGKTTWEEFQRPFKDGDIVVNDTPYTDDLQLFIFKNKKENSTLSSCYLMLDGDELDLEEGMYYITRLATEEEKAKLFQVIKDNGYKWNQETKTLEKLIESKFKIGDIIHNINNTNSKLKIIGIADNYYICENDFRIYFKYQENWEIHREFNWEKFEKINYKFNINTLVPFESKVLVRNADEDLWKPAIYGFSHQTGYYIVGGNFWWQCIPYEDNEHLLGTTDNCIPFYKTWINE